MANVPSYNERMDTIRMVEEICKTRGAYATKRFVSFDQMMSNILNRSKGLKSSLVNCITSIKNFISEYIKLAQIDLEVKTKRTLNWFKGYLNLILKVAKHGVKLATAFVERIMKQPIAESNSTWKTIKGNVKQIYNTKPIKASVGFASKSADKLTKSKGFPWAQIAIVSTIAFGIVSAVVILGISWWLKHVIDTEDKLRTDKTIFKKAGETWNDWLGNDEDDMADLEPPDPEVPNIAMTYVNEIQQSMFDFNLRTVPKVGSIIGSVKQKYFSSMMSDKEYSDADPDGDMLRMPDPSTSLNKDNLETPQVNQYNNSVQDPMSNIDANGNSIQRQSFQDPAFNAGATENPIQRQSLQGPMFNTDANGNPIQYQQPQTPMNSYVNPIQRQQPQAPMNRYGIPNPEDMPEIGMGLEQFDNPNLKESLAAVGAGLLFMLFLKAAIASSYNEEVAGRTMFLKSAVPNSAALGLTTNALALGAGAAAFSKK